MLICQAFHSEERGDNLKFHACAKLIKKNNDTCRLGRLSPWKVFFIANGEKRASTQSSMKPATIQDFLIGIPFLCEAHNMLCGGERMAMDESDSSADRGKSRSMILQDFRTILRNSFS